MLNPLPEINKIKEEMEALRWSQLTLSKESGVSQGTISWIFKNDDINPGYYTIKKLVTALINKSPKSDIPKAGDVCMPNVKHISENASLRIADEKFKNDGDTISQYPVYNKVGAVVGTLTKKSLWKAMTDQWQSKKVSEAMDPPPIIVDYNTPLSIVQDFLEKEQFVLVYGKSGRTIYGIITDYEIAKFQRKKYQK